MQFSAGRFKGLFCGALICALIFPTSSRSQTAFVRDDAFDIQGSHTLKVVTDPDNFTPFVTTNSDFPHFKLNVKKRDLWLTALPTIWIPQRYKIDIDGNTVVDWTADDERNISYQFPNPGGLSATHSVGIQVDYVDLGGHRLPTLSGSAPYTVFAKPRVHKDSDGNSFVQLRNGDATAKIPVLI